MGDKARIYTFGFTVEESKRIAAGLEELNVPPPIAIARNQWQVTIGDIIDNNRHGSEKTDCSERLILFFNISDRGINALIQYFKGLAVPQPIFAVVTDNSIKWTLSQLMDHLLAERNALDENRP
jgi:hypothetical protein